MTKASLPSPKAASTQPETPAASSAPHAAPRSMALPAAVPALLLLALVVVVKDTKPPLLHTLTVESPPATPDSVQTPMSPQLAAGILSSSQTMVVAPRRLSGYLLTARLLPTSSVTGQAPLSGQIARVLVHPGQRVQVNEKVLELSTGGAQHTAPRNERVETAAEAAQVAAVHQQEALNGKLQNLRTELAQKQVRVAAARARAAQARDIVQKLKRGETVHVPSAGAAAASKHQPRRAARPEVDADASAAQREAQKARRAADEAEDKVSQVHTAVKSADQKVREAQSAVDTATAVADKVQEAFEAGQAKGSDVATARAALASAKSEKESAEAIAAEAHHAVDQLQTMAARAREVAARASSRAVQLVSASKVVPAMHGDGPAADRTPEGQTDLTQAVEFVRQSVAESEAAAKDAVAIKSQIDNYEKQVDKTKQRLDRSAKGLEAAQQAVLDKNIEANLSSVRAPASGVVISVAEIAHDVSPGDPIVTIGRTDVLEARLLDYSQAWQGLRQDMLLPAVVREATPSEDAKADAAEQADSQSKKDGVGAARTAAQPHHSKVRGHRAQPVSVASNGTIRTAAPAALHAAAPNVAPSQPAASVSTMVRVHSITPPAQPGAPAVIRVRILNPRASGDDNNGQATRLFHSGMTVLCSLNRAPQQEAIAVPVSAILQASDGSHLVAVLKPLELPMVSATPAAATPPQAASGAANATPAAPPPVAQAAPGQAASPQTVALDKAEGAHRIEWRPVTLGSSDGQQQVIVDGLMPGERIALTPLALHQFEALHGPSTPVQLQFTS